MIDILKKNIEETMIIKCSEDIEEVKKNITLQLYYYLMEKENFTSRHITRALRDTLKFDPAVRQDVFIALCGEYLAYIENNEKLSNGSDIYLKKLISDPMRDINKIVNEITENPRIIQRICELNVNNIVEEIKNKRKISSSYMQKVAVNTRVTPNASKALEGAQNAYNGMRNYAEDIFNYNGLTFQDTGTNARRKNAIYEVGNMTGILNIGQRDNGQYKETQEDSILLYEHPENKKFKIAVVADGMGGMRKW